LRAVWDPAQPFTRGLRLDRHRGDRHAVHRPLRAVAYNLRHMTTDVSGQYDLWVFELVALVFVAVVAIATMALSGTV
jgi:hypothetical protein